MKKILTFLVIGLLAVCIIAAGACSSSTTSNGTSTTPVTNHNMQWSKSPAMMIDKNKTYTADIKTNFGDISIQLFPKDAPLTVNNFVFLAKQGYYNGVTFHRIVPDFVIQGGDPTGMGTGGPGYKFADEKVDKSYSVGTVAMANSGANTNGSQFFICLKDLSNQTRYFQAKAYNIFGIVTSGMDVVNKISELPTDANGKPTGQQAIIQTVTITEQ